MIVYQREHILTQQVDASVWRILATEIIVEFNQAPSCPYLAQRPRIWVPSRVSHTKLADSETCSLILSKLSFEEQPKQPDWDSQWEPGKPAALQTQPSCNDPLSLQHLGCLTESGIVAVCKRHMSADVAFASTGLMLCCA